jgi:hypothetical protein
MIGGRAAWQLQHHSFPWRLDGITDHPAAKLGMQTACQNHSLGCGMQQSTSCPPHTHTSTTFIHLGGCLPLPHTTDCFLRGKPLTGLSLCMYMGAKADAIPRPQGFWSHSVGCTDDLLLSNPCSSWHSQAGLHESGCDANGTMLLLDGWQAGTTSCPPTPKVNVTVGLGYPNWACE